MNYKCSYVFRTRRKNKKNASQCVNAATITIMKRKKKTSFIIGKRKLPAAPDPAQTRDRPGCRLPTSEEIADFAVELAREKYDLGQRMVELFHWPAWTTPCQDPRRLFLPIVEKYKKMAEEMLRRHYEYYYDLEIRRKRWLRAHPRPRGWTWTRKPLKHAVPPPRRRLFRPPELAYPDRGAPPPTPTPDGSPQRPGWRERERLLCYSRLFDNKIVFASGSISSTSPLGCAASPLEVSISSPYPENRKKIDPLAPGFTYISGYR